MDIKKEVESRYEEMKAVRRHMHRHPELSFQETNTKKYIYDQIKDLPLDIEKDVGGNGLRAMLHVSDDFKTVALRADFDALPIREENDVAYKSEVEGVMHACGHDAHTAMLITTAHILSAHKNALPVNVVFIFQHAEEQLPGGAKGMVEAGVLEGVDYVYGIHVSSKYPTGMLGYTYGYKHAAADAFHYKVIGRGGHGAEPHAAIDPVVASASLIQQLQTIASRTVDPLKSAVVTAGMFNAGSAFNIIPTLSEVSGTVRTFEKDVQDQVMDRMEGIRKGLEESYGVKCELEYNKGYPAVLNTDEAVDGLLEATETGTDFITSIEEVELSMGGEDFSYYLEKVPGAFFNIGTMNKALETDYPHHHPRFDIDEAGMKAGVESYLRLITNFR
ncbi:amidohydrolase [Lacicoccus alkaliphilus]|uniref:Amidohydrolase n=1 Tax=Lacicoccus alkaliphilus DSM 16010 TaxID=1123231 RepID=A0A1M7I0U4_9BACL|nr:amidohydrolase [Salinicoccus alkaliphilus]SHM34421.1 amidohydrolase [Salinicoccus alkaliphilus DSM 16010]